MNLDSQYGANTYGSGQYGNFDFVPATFVGYEPIKVQVVASAIAANSASTPRVGADASAAQLFASLSVTELSATVSYELLKLAYQTGLFLLYRGYTDAAQVQELFVSSFEKRLADAIDALEATAIELSKGALDEAVFGDLKAVDLAKQLGASQLEEFAAIDAQALLLAKALIDNALIADTLAAAFGKSLTEAASAVDNLSLASAKSMQNAASAIDAVATSLAKARDDTLTAADNREFLLGRSLSDTVTATDDVDGAATIADDQRTNFFKATADIAAVSDVVQRMLQFERALADSASTAEIAARAIAKVLGVVKTVGSIGTYGSGAYGAGRYINLSLPTYGAGLYGSGVYGDANSYENETLLPTHIASASDALGLSTARPVNDSATAADFALRMSAKVMTDAMGASQMRAMSLAKITVDGVSVGDSIQIVFSAGLRAELADSASVQSFGELRSQGYGDLSYFAGDYVGTSQTFT